jgi:hypothetical protein
MLLIGSLALLPTSSELIMSVAFILGVTVQGARAGLNALVAEFYRLRALNNKRVGHRSSAASRSHAEYITFPLQRHNTLRLLRGALNWLSRLKKPNRNGSKFPWRAAAALGLVGYGAYETAVVSRPPDAPEPRAFDRSPQRGIRRACAKMAQCPNNRTAGHDRHCLRHRRHCHPRILCRRVELSSPASRTGRPLGHHRRKPRRLRYSAGARRSATWRDREWRPRRTQVIHRLVRIEA